MPSIPSFVLIFEGLLRIGGIELPILELQYTGSCNVTRLQGILWSYIVDLSVSVFDGKVR